MTNISESQRWVLVLPPELNDCREHSQVFSLPHPSNNTSKKRIKLIDFQGRGIYQLKAHEFSQGSSYNHDYDQAEDKYHYTNDGKPIKSTLITDGRDSSNGYVLEEGSFFYLSRFDITFGLIGFFYKKFTVSDEKDYIKNEIQTGAATTDENIFFLRLRDFHDLLIDSYDSEWRNVSLDAFKTALENISDPIEEAGDIYYKITVERITQCLVRKTKQILNSFPTTVPIPSSLPPDIMESAKITISVNLFISLIPAPAYWHLINHSGEDLEVARAFQKYEEYTKNMGEIMRKKEFLVHNAMNVGLADNSTTERTTKTTKKVLKKSTTQKKVVIGKGAIDGFFKKAK